ncbi:MAG: OmpA family protein [Pseudomonadota bacterium]
MRIVQGRALAILLAALVLFAPCGTFALTLNLPAGAVETGDDRRAADQFLLPIGPRDATGGPGLMAEGRIERRAWSLPDSTATPFQILAPVIEQLEALGFKGRYACRDRDCGGFDFRLALDLLPAPAMYVDLGDFRYVAAEREGPSGLEVIALVASRSEGGGHLHLTLVTPTETPDTFQATTQPVLTDTAPPTSGLAATLDTTGRVVLADLTFQPGSSQLGAGPFASLEALAAWLAANPDKTLVLVGHSDNVGGLDENIRLSELRARAVMRALTEGFDVPGSRLSARGVGFLAPLVSNATPEGRRQNRRVEAIIADP